MSTKTVKRGFTLIELLVVIAIIAILAAILFPVFARAREKARQTTCQSNQRQIAASIQMYVQDHEETLPASVSVWSDIKVDPGVLICPTKGKNTINGFVYSSFVASRAIGDFDDPSAEPLTMDGVTSAGLTDNVFYGGANSDKRHSGKSIYSYIDGHVAAVDVWKRVIATDNLKTYASGAIAANAAFGKWSADATAGTLTIGTPSPTAPSGSPAIYATNFNGTVLYYQFPADVPVGDTLSMEFDFKSPACGQTWRTRVMSGATVSGPNIDIAPSLGSGNWNHCTIRFAQTSLSGGTVSWDFGAAGAGSSGAYTGVANRINTNPRGTGQGLTNIKLSYSY